MDYGTISTMWASLEKSANIIILTEPERLPIAEKMKADNMNFVKKIKLIDISKSSTFEQEINRLTEKDLLIVLLTIDGFMKKGYRERFSPFSKPFGLVCKYIFIRLDIPESALLSGLNTEITKVEAIINKYKALSGGKRVRISSDKGTDITTQIDYQECLPYDARSLGGNAFLPPAEISEELVHNATNGILVADITVGELRFGAELVDSLGLVDTDVRITVKKGMVTEIAGGDIACRLKNGLNKLNKSLQVIVELGHGLSDISPTGIIGVDESMNGTCHFGIGDRNPYHVDVVVSNPEIVVSD